MDGVKRSHCKYKKFMEYIDENKKYQNFTFHSFCVVFIFISINGPEVQNRGVSGPTKRTYVLQNLKKTCF